MYTSDLRTSPPLPQVDAPVRLHVTIRDDSGRAVRELGVSHEKPMHLVVVSRDLRDFAHLHPAAQGDHFEVEHVFGHAGEHLLFVDYRDPDHGQIVDRHRLHVPGDPEVDPAPPPASEHTQRAGGLEVMLSVEGALRAGEGVSLHFHVADAQTRRPVSDLDPYLGAKAHFIGLSADGVDFVHLHPMDDESVTSTVSAHAVFPRPGTYKLWAQLQRRGVVVTLPFLLHVEPPAGDRGSKPTSPGRRSHHKH
jgi:hypothetical protein